MHNLNERIRHTRARSRMSQSELAARVGVQRSAVAQWESRSGTRPSMDHLMTIAVATNVSLEWLGTGRGTLVIDRETAHPAVNMTDYIQDAVEAKCLESIRKLPCNLKRQVASMLVLLSNNYR